MINNLKPMFVFAKTVELGSFRAAAKALNLSPSVVSYHISQLEEQFEVALLYRSTRKLSLTDQGKKLFDCVNQMVRSAEQGVDSLTGKAQESFGKLVITAPAALSRGLLINDIASFAKLNSKIELLLNFTDSPQDLIADGIDIAIRVGELKDSSLKSRKITEMERKLVATPGYIESKPEPRSPRDFSKWEWIRFSSVSATRVFTAKNGRSEKIKFDSRIAVDNADALCQFVKAGLGLGTPPLFLIENDLKAGRLVEVLPNWKIDSLPVYGVWPINTPRSSLTNLFVEYLVNKQKPLLS